jgi:hypothetical protein
MTSCAYTWIDNDGRKRQCRRPIDLTKLCRWCSECDQLIRAGMDPERLRLRARAAELMTDHRALELEEA